MENKEDSAKGTQCDWCFIKAAAVTFVVWLIGLILSLLYKSESKGWTLFHDLWSPLSAGPTVLFTIAFPKVKSNVIEKIGDCIREVLGKKWDSFFTAVLEKNDVRLYEKIGDRIIEAQRKKNFYDVIYPTRNEMFNHKKLYKVPGKSITYISMSGAFLSADREGLLEQLGNKKISIYVLNPLSDCVKKRIDELHPLKNDYRLFDDIIQTVERFNEIVQSPDFKVKAYTHDFKVYMYDSLPYMSGAILEKEENNFEYYITHHLFYEDTNDCPSFSVNNLNKSYDVYKKMFKRFIDDNAKNLILYYSKKDPKQKFADEKLKWWENWKKQQEKWPG